MKAATNKGRKTKPDSEKVTQYPVYLTPPEQRKYLKAKKVKTLTEGIRKDLSEQ